MVLHPCRTVVQSDYCPIPLNMVRIEIKKRTNPQRLKPSHDRTLELSTDQTPDYSNNQTIELLTRRTVKSSNLSPSVAFFVLRPCRTKPTLSGEVRNGMKEEANGVAKAGFRVPGFASRLRRPKAIAFFDLRSHGEGGGEGWRSCSRAV